MPVVTFPPRVGTKNLSCHSCHRAGAESGAGRRMFLGGTMNRIRNTIGGAVLAFALFTGSQALAQNDTLIIGVGSEVQSLDPRLATDVASAMRTNVMMESLVVFNQGLGLEPRLATDWELSDDLLSFTFFLRDDVT